MTGNEIYADFADVYAKGSYTRHGREVAAKMPEVLGHLEHRPQKILDMCCGEGSFAVEMAKRGMRVTGVDASERMLEIANARALIAKVTDHVRFERRDVRVLRYDGEFDLATCWFDSLNYMLTTDDLGKAFGGAARALRPGAYLMFDMQTIHGLINHTRRHEHWIERDSDGIVDIHRAEYDEDTGIASLHITGFLHVGGGKWRRFDEVHRQRAYPEDTIARLLEESGFEVVQSSGNLDGLADLTMEIDRMWWVARRA
ncbi:MAG: class I SAM-dependent methyltransferase [Thermoplasmata archaeon]|nr:class I SAM-dependent methyltransferase [Thermoplasmata archaeon]